MLLSPGYLVLGDSRAQETELLDRAIRANVVINSLNARGLYTKLLGDAGATRDRMDHLVGATSSRARRRTKT